MSPKETATLAAEHITLAHRKFTVAENLSVHLPTGKVTAIVGPNGCGKSTLLNGLARIHTPRDGSVLLNGKDIHRLPSKEVARKLALLPQDNSAPEGLTVADLVRFGRQPHQGWMKQWSNEDQQAFDQAVQAADIRGLSGRALDTLSGGQRQRAWIAMAVAQQTPLLLLDEPTSALDLGHQIEVFELIRTLSHQGKTIAMVVHDLASACRYADYMVAMKNGTIIEEGSPADIVSPALVKHLYGIECELMHDPATGSPLLVNLRRCN